MRKFTQEQGATKENRRRFPRRFQKALHYTQEYVAEQVGITLRFYQMIERGEKSVSLDTLIALRKTLTISMDSLLLGELPSSCENP